MNCQTPEKQAKKIAVVALWTFAAAAVVFHFAKNGREIEQTVLPEGISATFFCSSVRCASCLEMERLFRQTLRRLADDAPPRSAKSVLFGKLSEAPPLDYEAPENRRIAEEFRVATSTVLLTERRGGKTLRFKNLASECWRRLGDAEAFEAALSREISAFFDASGATSKTNDAAPPDETFPIDADATLFD